jgi:hypothetical protein
MVAKTIRHVVVGLLAVPAGVFGPGCECRCLVELPGCGRGHESASEDDEDGGRLHCGGEWGCKS